MDVFPDVVRIETVGICNFKCVHCPTGIDPNNRSVLKKEQFHFILDQFRVKDFIPRVVVLYHGGEPLLNNNLSYFIKTLKSFGVKKVAFTTNASLLNKERAREIIASGLDELKVSFDGVSAEENDQIRIGGSFHENANNAREFIRTRSEMGALNPVVTINSIRIADESTLTKMAENGNFLYSNPPEYLARYFGDETDLLKYQSYAAMKWPGLRLPEQYAIKELGLTPPDYCDYLFETTTILSTGDIVACCHDLPGETVLGNIFDKNIFEIWEGEKYQAMRDSFKNKKREYFDMCSRCIKVKPSYLCKK